MSGKTLWSELCRNKSALTKQDTTQLHCYNASDIAFLCSNAQLPVSWRLLSLPASLLQPAPWLPCPGTQASLKYCQVQVWRIDCMPSTLPTTAFVLSVSAAWTTIACSWNLCISDSQSGIMSVLAYLVAEMVCMHVLCEIHSQDQHRQEHNHTSVAITTQSTYLCLCRCISLGFCSCCIVD